jgi:hypothetical protein
LLREGFASDFLKRCVNRASSGTVPACVTSSFVGSSRRSPS